MSRQHPRWVALCAALLYLAGCIPTRISWSPDSSLIAFVQHGERQVKGPDGKEEKRPYAELWVWDVKAEKGTLVVKGENGLSAAAFAPTGKRLAFIEQMPKPERADQPRQAALCLFDLERNAKTEVVRWPLDGDLESANLASVALSWSPDGRSLAYQKALKNRVELCVADVAGRTSVTLGEKLFQPAWSPDGRWIACVGPGRPEEEGSCEIMLSNPKGTERRGVGYAFLGKGDTRGAFAGWPGPAWSPDSSGILYTSCLGTESRQTAVFMADLKGGKEAMFVAEEGHFVSVPSWSRDGAHLVVANAVVQSDRAKSHILVVDVKTKATQSLASWLSFEESGKAEGPLNLPAVSPDGQWIACRLGVNGVGLFRRDGSETRYAIVDEASLNDALNYQIGVATALEQSRRYAEARKAAGKALDLLGRKAQNTPEVLPLKCLLLPMANRHREALEMLQKLPDEMRYGDLGARVAKVEAGCLLAEGRTADAVAVYEKLKTKAANLETLMAAEVEAAKLRAALAWVEALEAKVTAAKTREETAAGLIDLGKAWADPLQNPRRAARVFSDALATELPPDKAETVRALLRDAEERLGTP